MERQLLPDDIFGPSLKKPGSSKSKPAIKAKPAPAKAAPAPTAQKTAAPAKVEAKKAVPSKPATPVKGAAKPTPKPVAKPAKKPAPIKAAAAQKPKKAVVAKPVAKKSAKVKKSIEAKAAKPAKVEKPKAVKPAKSAKPAKKAAPASKGEPIKVVHHPSTAPRAEPEAAGEPDRRKLIEEFLKARKVAAPEPEPEPECEDLEVSAEEELEMDLGRMAQMLEEANEGGYLDGEQSDESSAGHIEDHDYRFCPVCRAHLPENASKCPHCYVPVILCPYCGRRAGGVENPKMVTEQRFNRILKQYTLFGLAFPSMPIQPILDCSKCKSRVIVCESCNAALKHSATACPVCNEKVRRTKMLINPLTILESITKRPEALRGIQKLIEMFVSSQSK